MNDMEIHVIRTTVVIKKVNLAVRFPCSLLLQLKNQSTSADGRGSHELKAGTCEPNQKIAIDSEVSFRNGEYADKKIVLIVLMASANGKIPAGSITIKIAERGKLNQSSMEEAASIEKCPDKSAKAYFSTKVEFIRSQRKQSNNSRSKGKKIKVGASMSPLSLRKHFTGGSSQVVMKTQQQTHRSGRMKTYIEGVSNLPINTKNDFHMYEKKSYEDDDESNQKGNSIIYEQFEQDQSNYKGKMLRLEKEKADNRKEIAKLKGQLYSMKKEQHWNGYEEQLERYKSEVDTLTSELLNMKDRNKMLERKERDQTSTIKDLKDQLQKLRNKTNAAENLNFEVKISLDEKDKIIRMLSDEIKGLKQELEDKKISINMHDKRAEFKQTAFKEQIHKLTEKYQQSEIQRQKATFQLNNMLSQFETSEKKSQLHNKEKERSFLEQKNKLTKKVETLTNSLKISQEENEDLKINIQQMQNLMKLNQRSKEQFNVEYEELKVKFIALEGNCRKLTSSCTQKERQIQELQIVQQDYQALKKRHTQLTMQHTKITQALTKANKQINSHQITINGLEDQIKQSNSLKDSLNNKNLNLNKEVNSLNKSLSEKSDEITSMNDTIINLTTRLTETKLKLDAQKMDFEESNGKLSTQIVYLLKTKDYLENEIEELKWKVQKNQDLNDSLNHKCSELNEKVLKFNEELLNEQERNKNMKEVIKDNQGTIEHYKSEILNKQAKEKDLQAMIKTKTQTEYSLKKTIKEKEQEIYLLREKSKNYETESSDKIQILETNLRERENLVTQLKKQLSETSSKQQLTQGKKEQVSKNYERLVQENNYHKEMIDQNKRKIIELENNIEELKRTINNISEEKDAEVSKKNEVLGKLSKSQEESKVMRADWENYRKQTYQAMEQFFSQINKESSKASVLNENSSFEKPKSTHDLLAFPDENLSNLQIQSFKKRTELLIKFQEKIKILQENLSFTTTELEKLKEFSNNREEQLEQEIEKEKIKVRELTSELLHEKNELMEKIMNSEEKGHQISAENEKLSVELGRIKEESQEFERLYLSERQEKLSKQNIIKNLHKEIEELNKSQQIKHQSSNTEYSSVIEEKKSQIDRLRNQIRDYEKKTFAQQKAISSLQEENTKQKNKLADALHSKQKLQRKVQFEEIKYHELMEIKKSLENQIRNLENKLKQAFESETSIVKQLNDEKFKVEDMKIRINKANEEISNKQLQIKRLTNEVQLLSENIAEMDNQGKKSSEKYKDVSEKKNQIIKDLQEKIIALTSEIQLKTFLHSQGEVHIGQLKNVIQELTGQINSKKQEIIRLQQNLEDLKNQVIFLHQSQDSLQREKESIQSEYYKQKDIIQTMNSEAMQHSMTSELLSSKEREVERLKEDLDNMEIRYQTNNKELRQVISDLRRDMSAKSLKEEELKRKVREMQRDIETRVYDMNKEKTRFREETDREKVDLIRELEAMEKENNNLRNEFDYMREQSSKEIQSVNQECYELSGLLAEKEELLISKNDQIKENEKKIKLLSNQLKNYVEGLGKSDISVKSGSNLTPESQSNNSMKYKLLIDEIDSKSRSLLSRSRRNTSTHHQ